MASRAGAQNKQIGGIAARADLSASLDRVIKLALEEDLNGSVDITSEATVPADLKVKATVLVKEPGVIAGLEAFSRVFAHLDPLVSFTAILEEGTTIETAPAACGTLSGPARSILTGERTALNIMQRLSGIATRSRQFAKMAQPYGIAILDTRKTTPGLRLLEKYAVAVGGAVNHRTGLYDAILIKDNHVRIAGGVREAVKRARLKYGDMPIQVEVTNLVELAEAMDCAAEKVLLDNMTADEVIRATRLVAGRSYIELSGGINAENIEQYLIEGVNAISMGALTHSVKSLDISLEIEG